MSNVWIFFISRAFVVFRAVCFPVSEAHPAEIMFAIIALHVIAATILLYADVAFGTLQQQASRDDGASGGGGENERELKKHARH